MGNFMIDGITPSKVMLNGNSLNKFMMNGVEYSLGQTSIDYNWNLTQSIVDTNQGVTLKGFLNQNSTDSVDIDGLAIYRQGIGIQFLGDNYNSIHLPVNLFKPGYLLEIDFANFEVTYRNMDWAQFFVGTHKCCGYINNSDYYFKWGVGDGVWFIGGSYNVNGDAQMESGGYYQVYYQDPANLFANSTLKIRTIASANNHVRWELYRDSMYLGTTPELTTKSTAATGSAFFPDNAQDSDFAFELFGRNYLKTTVTGIRIRQL